MGTTSIRASLSLAGAMAIAGSSVVVAKIIVADFPIFLANELRFAIASAILVPLLLARTRGVPRFSRRDGIVLAAQAMSGVFLFNVCLFYGVRLTTAAEAGIITSVTPMVVGVMGVLFLGESPTRHTVAGIAFAVLGIASLELFGSGTGATGGSSSILGNSLIVVAVVSEALFTVLGRAISDRVTPLEITTTVSVVGSVLFLPLALSDLAGFDPGAVPPSEWIPIGYYGVVVTVVAFVLWFRGVSLVPASTAAAFTGVLPVSAVFLSYVLLGEVLSVGHLIGIGCVLVGIGVSTRRMQVHGESGGP